MTDLSEALGVARQVAELGGRIAMSHFGRQPESKKKDDGSWVTEADWAVEAQIRLRLSRAFPDHNLLGEEEGLTAAGGGPAVEGAPTWVIDPIDGTNNYMRKIPVWATLVALQIDGENVLGVCHAPALGETYDAARGFGARMNGTDIRVSEISEMAEATFLHGGPERFATLGIEDHYLALAAASWRTRGFADFWGHMLVARGAAEIMIEPELSVWDVAALEPIVTEAGGRLTNLDGKRWKHLDSCVTTNGKLHDAALYARRTNG